MESSIFRSALTGNEQKITGSNLEILFVKSSEFVRRYEEDIDALKEDLVLSFENTYINSEAFNDYLRVSSANKIKLNLGGPMGKEILQEIYDIIKNDMNEYDIDEKKNVLVLYLEEVDVNVCKKDVSNGMNQNGMEMIVEEAFFNIECQLKFASIPFADLYDCIVK